jgi:hypothetical protein
MIASFRISLRAGRTEPGDSVLSAAVVGRSVSLSEWSSSGAASMLINAVLQQQPFPPRQQELSN